MEVRNEDLADTETDHAREGQTGGSAAIRLQVVAEPYGAQLRVRELPADIRGSRGVHWQLLRDGIFVGGKTGLRNAFEVPGVRKSLPTPSSPPRT